jgi:hypothetical protein
MFISASQLHKDFVATPPFPPFSFSPFTSPADIYTKPLFYPEISNKEHSLLSFHLMFSFIYIHTSHLDNIQPSSKQSIVLRHPLYAYNHHRFQSFVPPSNNKYPFLNHLINFFFPHPFPHTHIHIHSKTQIAA